MVTCCYLHGCVCLSYVPFPRVTCLCHMPFPRVTCQSSNHLTIGGFRGGYIPLGRGRGVCLWLCRQVIGDMWGTGAATSCARDSIPSLGRCCACNIRIPSLGSLCGGVDFCHL